MHNIFIFFNFFTKIGGKYKASALPAWKGGCFVCYTSIMTGRTMGFRLVFLKR